MRAAMLLMLLTGCMTRQILQIEDGPDQGAGTTTVLTTLDMKNYLVFGVTKRVYWECANSGSGLVCEQTCDVKDDEGEMLLCPKLVGGAL